METDGLCYFNRCRRCTRLLTKLELKAALAVGGDICSCGSGMFSPCNLVWTDWFKPRVLKMALHFLLGKLPPQPDDGVRPPLPVMDYPSVPPLSSDEIRMPEDGE